MKLATPMGALSGNSVQVSLPAVVSMTAIGPAAGAAAGLAVAAAVAGYFAGADFAAGAACDQPAAHMAEINKEIERPFRMEAPDTGFRPAGG